MDGEFVCEEWDLAVQEEFNDAGLRIWMIINSNNN